MMFAHALVTGASSGIGRSLSLALAAQGTHVVVAARRKPELDSLVAEICAAGGKAEALVLDVAQADATYDAVRALDERLPLDLVVANAGVGGSTPSKRTTWPAVRKILDINLYGALATLMGALPGMVARDQGHLVGVASVAGFRGLPKFSAYGASKAALISFLESMRLDLHSTRLAVTVVCPGFVRTEMTAKVKATPFMLESSEAARIILRSLERRDFMCTFPLPVAAVMRSLPFIPTALYDFALTKVKLPY
jgi:short-subunit dehydrogenase